MATTSDDLVVLLYRQMLLVRLVDERLAALHREGRIPPHVGARGEEAAILGAAAALRSQDWIFPSSHEIGAALWRGISLQSYAHKVLGNALDPGKGRELSERLGARKAKIASPSGVAGAHIAHAVGFAWGAKSRREDVVALAYFDRAATSGADFHNALNFAGVFKPPVVLFCRTSEASRASRETASTSVAAKAIAYGIAGASVDGGDLLAVLTTVREAVATAASGGGPTLVEAMTPRAGTADDPIARLRGALETRSLWSDAKQRELELQLDAEVILAITEAERTIDPMVATLFDDVYAELPWHLREQRALLEKE